MSYFVYVLQSDTTKRFYIGSTNNLARRLNEHNKGKNLSTRNKGKWRLVYQEEFGANIEAKRREKQIKSYKSGNAFKRLFLRT